VTEGSGRQTPIRSRMSATISLVSRSEFRLAERGRDVRCRPHGRDKNNIVLSYDGFIGYIGETAYLTSSRQPQ
jgi:hypothetical protein